MLQHEIGANMTVTDVATRHESDRILCPICRASNRGDARFCQQCGKDVLLDNIYRITRVIKEGGMGVVYQAVDEDGEVYAIKEMHDRFVTPEDRREGIQHFIDEAHLLRSLHGHPNIPNVYRSFIDEGRYYLSMEFIFGEDLEDIMKRRPRLPEGEVLLWADQLCDVLEFMHSKGLIYRDMKPSNIMIARDGTVKVIDFGIAKLLQPGQRASQFGTPGYTPPEQYQGLSTEQSDLYALAATLHHVLTGRDPRNERPFSFPPARSLRHDISVRTSMALEKALQPELADRFPNLTAFRRALPIPTGDARAVARPAPQAPRQAESTPRRAAPPVPAPQRRTAPRRRSSGAGRAVRRAVAAGIIASGLYFGALQVAPETVAAVQDYVSAVIERAVAPDASNGD